MVLSTSDKSIRKTEMRNASEASMIQFAPTSFFFFTDGIFRPLKQLNTINHTPKAINNPFLTQFPFALLVKLLKGVKWSKKVASLCISLKSQSKEPQKKFNYDEASK
jgi:hypothetical protein